MEDSTKSANNSSVSPTTNTEIWKFSFIFVLPGIVCIMGIPGCVVCIRFFGRRIQKSSTATSLFLTSLSVFDLLSLLFILPSIGVSIPAFYVEGKTSDILFTVVSFLSRVLKHCSHLMLSVIAAERLVSVVRPHKLKTVFTKKVGVICIIAICIFSPVSNLPLILGFGTRGVIGLLPKEEIAFPVYSTLHKISVFVYFFLPLVCIFVCNVSLVILLLHRHRSKTENQTSITSSQARELRMTKLVIVVTAIFIVCTVPLVAIYPLQASGILDISMKTLLIMRPFASLFETINYSMNVVVYYIGNVAFREETLLLISMSCKCFNKRSVGPATSINENDL